MPVYNRAGLVGATLASLAAQTARPIEVILVDNNSTDGTYDVLEQWAGSVRAPGFDVVVVRCVRSGAAAARNTGLELARAEWVMFFDSDDTMPPRHVADALAAVEEHPEADIIGWDYMSSDGRRKRLNRFFGHDMQWNNLFHGAMSTQRWCARTKLVREVGGWNEDVRYWDDIELGCRMLAFSPSVYYMGFSGIEVFEHVDSITATHAVDPSRVEPALQAMAATLGGTMLPDLKRAIEYGLTVRAGNSRGRELMSKLLKRNGLSQRFVLWLAYTHTRLGLRGAATLLKLFVGKIM